MKNVTFKKIYGVLISFLIFLFKFLFFYGNLKMIIYQYGLQLPLKREYKWTPPPYRYQFLLFYLAGRIKALVLEFGGLVILSSILGLGSTETSH